MDRLIARIEQDLLPHLDIVSEHPGEPVVARRVPPGWELVGCGNYAAVFGHPAHPDEVVKVYARGRPGIGDERDVYARLGDHPAYSRCLYGTEQFLVLRRLVGNTMFECLRSGFPIPRAAIAEIDRALDYARTQGLNPHDVHAKNVMISPAGHGLVVDVSDFGHAVACRRWDDVKRAYRWLYLPFLSWNRIPVPMFVLDLMRRLYRRLR